MEDHTQDEGFFLSPASSSPCAMIRATDGIPHRTRLVALYLHRLDDARDRKRPRAAETQEQAEKLASVASNPRVPLVIGIIFPVAAVATERAM